MNTAVPDEFDAIRPYRDDEVRATLARLLSDAELLRAVAAYLVPRFNRLAPWAARRVLSLLLHRRTRHISSVRSFQKFLESYFARMVAATTDGFSHDGIDRLEKGHGYLFVGNHRDIAMDSAFLNYALWRSGHDTVRIAIGDNLLQRPFATDLMRLNKSFIVRRSLSGPKEMLAAYRLTSNYLHHSIAERASVWIAQREGRAKDGWDRTDPAIIKMFVVSKRKGGQTFGELIGSLGIVPVAVSYETDPCDLLKAHELAVTAQAGRYAKPPDADLQSIVRGITGHKGRVHLSVGQPLGAGFEDADAVAAAIDMQIRQRYRLWPTHWWAARELGVPCPPDPTVAEPENMAVARLRERVRLAPAGERAFLLCQYANPVCQHLGLPALDVGMLKANSSGSGPAG